MKKLTFLLVMTGLLMTAVPGFPVAYEASTLHNAVARSESVQGLFFQRWQMIQDNNWNFDFYGKINWVPGFKIYTVDRLTGDKKAVDMRLIRTYGGFTWMYQFGKPEPGKESEGSDIQLGISTVGYHYGLTRSAKLDRGTAGTETITDYKYAQFFDDIFAASFVWKPYVYFHGGLLMNNIVEPNDDGTMDYFNSSGLKYRWFIASNILGFLDNKFMLRESEIESVEVDLNINKLVNIFLKKLNPLIPGVTLGYKQIGIFNDEAWDPVWVKDVYVDGTAKDSANLYIFRMLVEENLFKMVYISADVEFQWVTEDMYLKRFGNSRVSFTPLRKFKFAVAYDFFHTDPSQKLLATVGYSTFWDPGMPYHTDDGRFRAHGFYSSVAWKTKYFGTALRVAYNDAEELDKLVETVDKVALEWEFNVSMNFWSFKEGKKGGQK